MMITNKGSPLIDQPPIKSSVSADGTNPGTTRQSLGCFTEVNLDFANVERDPVVLLWNVNTSTGSDCLDLQNKDLVS